MTKTFEKHLKSMTGKQMSAAWILPDGRTLVTDGPRAVLLPEGAELPEWMKPIRMPEIYKDSVGKLVQADEDGGPGYKACPLPPLKEMKDGIKEASGGARNKRVTWSDGKGFVLNARFAAGAMEALGCRAAYLPEHDITKYPAIFYARDDFFSGVKEFVFGIS